MDNANLKPSMEGGLEKPTRHIIDWKNPDFLNEEKYEEELRRVADACHGCRRCVSLCNSFPTLFDLIDESATFEVDGVSYNCLLYTSPSPRDRQKSRMPSSA